jgi:uncharacterized protein GlcG (DUF336 family)
MNRLAKTTRTTFSLVILLLASTLAQDITTVRQLSAKLAMEAVTAALDSCVAEGYRVSVAIVDRTGLVRATVRGDGAGPHTHESALRKAYTSATLGALTSELATRIQDPNLATLKDIPGVLFLAGGVPIRVGEELIGGIGVAGAPGGNFDEACGNAGIAAIQDRLQ